MILVVVVMVVFVVKIWILGCYTHQGSYKILQKKRHKVNNIVTIHVFIYFQQKTKEDEKNGCKSIFPCRRQNAFFYHISICFHHKAKEAAATPSKRMFHLCLSVHYFSNKSHLSWAHLTFTNLLGEMWDYVSFHASKNVIELRCLEPPLHVYNKKKTEQITNQAIVFIFFVYAFACRNC